MKSILKALEVEFKETKKIQEFFRISYKDANAMWKDGCRVK